MTSPVVSVEAMRAAENAAFARGVSPETLMQEAGGGIARVVRAFFPHPQRCLAFIGKGNNGGDAVVAATELRLAGWETDLRLTFPEKDCGDLLRKKLAQYYATSTGASAQTSSAPAVLPTRRLPDEMAAARLIVLDGLLGLGSTPPLRGPLLSAAREINELRRAQHARVLAIDQPSGLDAETGAADANCILADVTIAIGATKRGLLADGVIDYVGRLAVVPLPELRLDQGSESVAIASSLQNLLPLRNFGAYKNQFGRIGIVAGSRGLVGAAVLCAEGALRGGAGLVRVYVREDIYPILAAAAPAEAMIQPVDSYARLPEEAVDAWAIGPGLGKIHAEEVLSFIERVNKPMVIDADALNIVAARQDILRRSRGPRLLTPHPGEMKRLTGQSDAARAEIARKFAHDFPVTLLFKGSRTIVAEGDRLSYNTTGNPGMATGGMGDVLTGVCAALLGQKLNTFDAARLGAWVCGRAAEIAIFRGAQSEQSLLARDITAHLGPAFSELPNSN